MSLLVCGLTFDGADLNAAKAAVLGASVLSAILGTPILRRPGASVPS